MAEIVDKADTDAVVGIFKQSFVDSYTSMIIIVSFCSELLAIGGMSTIVILRFSSELLAISSKQKGI